MAALASKGDVTHIWCKAIVDRIKNGQDVIGRTTPELVASRGSAGSRKQHNSAKSPVSGKPQQMLSCILSEG